MSTRAATGRRQPVRGRGRETRQAILDAALELVAERGAAGATHRAIAQRAGCTLGMTSYFFRSIDELTAAAMAHHYGRRIDEYRLLAGRLAAGGLPPAEIIDAAATAISSEAAPQVAAHLEILVGASRRPDLRDLAARYVAEFDALVVATLRGMQAPDPERAAPAVSAVIDGLLLRRLAFGLEVGEVRELMANAFLTVWKGARDDPPPADAEGRAAGTRAPPP